MNVADVLRRQSHGFFERLNGAAMIATHGQGQAELGQDVRIVRISAQRTTEVPDRVTQAAFHGEQRPELHVSLEQPVVQSNGLGHLHPGLAGPPGLRVAAAQKEAGHGMVRRGLQKALQVGDGLGESPAVHGLLGALDRRVRIGGEALHLEPYRVRQKPLAGQLPGALLGLGGTIGLSEHRVGPRQGHEDLTIVRLELGGAFQVAHRGAGITQGYRDLSEGPVSEGQVGLERHRPGVRVASLLEPALAHQGVAVAIVHRHVVGVQLDRRQKGRNDAIHVGPAKVLDDCQVVGPTELPRGQDPGPVIAGRCVVVHLMSIEHRTERAPGLGGLGIGEHALARLAQGPRHHRWHAVAVRVRDRDRGPEQEQGSEGRACSGQDDNPHVNSPATRSSSASAGTAHAAGFPSPRTSVTLRSTGVASKSSVNPSGQRTRMRSTTSDSPTPKCASGALLER